ncbi:zinc finger FYVE-related protein [Fadolivirus algeromassiliense]|jgi:hypothetical protein|uniref:Zinc finger FYVE-related protein n=1 Tax=Fadolivirus FV1/VV64 TaxID=3070911 RepID=A0A7D3QXS3_9VIRU|nr:zinc finger FYVE-related protein [Fadolivirus algeromassiliense]QKF94700.1 zinc finger FYVE-related protein [Fadolivirus FV1/VV64]
MNVVEIDDNIKYSSDVSKKWFQSKKYIWQQDDIYGYDLCSCCEKQLTTFTTNPDFAKHHARCCGKIICNLCSRAPEGVVLKKGCPERCCRDCFPELEAVLSPLIVKPLCGPIEESQLDDTDKSIHVQVNI